MGSEHAEQGLLAYLTALPEHLQHEANMLLQQGKLPAVITLIEQHKHQENRLAKEKEALKARFM